MKRMTVTGLVLLFLCVFATGNSAAAEPKPPAAVEVVSSVMAAWDCESSHFCAWPNQDGTGSRCSWSDADSDWLSGTVQCSWAGSLPVRSYWNRGTSTNFRGVMLFMSANNWNLAYCVPQGGKFFIEGGGTFLRSHRWDSWTPGTCGP